MAQMEPSAQARQALSSCCICLTDVPSDINPDHLRAQFQGLKLSQITSPNGNQVWLVWLYSPMAVQQFVYQPTYQLDVDGKTRVPVKIESCIPCDVPSEWVDEFVKGGMNFAYGGGPFMGQNYYPGPFPQGPQQGYPQGPYPGFPQGPHQGYPQYPPQGPQDGMPNAEGDTQPKVGGPGGQAMGFGPRFAPPWGHHGPPQHWGYPPNQGAPPPYNGKEEGAQAGPPGAGYVSDIVSCAQDEFLTKIERKRQKEEKREPEESMDEEPKRTNMIKVSKLPKGTTKDALTYFFENRRKSGGGDTEDVDFDESDMTAIITFEDPDAVGRILQKLPMLFQEKQIVVEEFYPHGKDAENHSIDEDEEKGNSKPLCTIEIKGFKPGSTDDTIQFYFENGKRSGGGDIKDFRRESDVIYITFQDEKTAKSVAERKHKVDEAALNVKVYVPPPPRQMYSDKVFIQGLNPSTTKDCLSNFLEAKSGSTSTDIVYGEEDGTALVTFEEDFDFEKLQKNCKKRALEGCYLSVSKVPVTNCLKVYGFSDGTSQDTLEFYFENSKRSGGGELESIELNKEDGTCLIFFKDHKVLPEVCKRTHKIDEQQLKLRVYHECLGNISDDEDDLTRSHGGAGGGGGGGGGRKFKQPESFSLSEADKRKVEFLKHSKSVREAVEKQLKQCHAKVQWPKSKNDFMVIDCLLTAEIKDCKSLAKMWKKTATDSLNQFLDALIVEEKQVLQEAWMSVKEGLKGMTISHPDGIAVISEPDSCQIVLVGYKHIVKDVLKQVNDVIAKVGEDLDRKKQQMTEKVKAKYHQTRMLILTHFPDKMKKKFPGLVVRIDLKNKEMTFEGLSSEINSGKLEMYEIFNKITSSKVDQFSKEKLEFCDTPKVREYIVAKLKKDSIIAVWEIESQRNVNMYALCDKDAVQAAHIFQQSILETPVDLAEESVYLLQSAEWSATKKQVEDVDTGLVKIVEDPNNKKIIIFTTSENVGNCREMVDDFLMFNTITERELTLSSSEMRFITQQHSREITQIAKDLKDDKVKITTGKSGIMIKGTNQGLNKAQQRIDTIIQKIVKKSHTFQKPGMAKYISSNEGQAKLKKVEKEKKCVIDSSESSDSDGSGIGDSDSSMPSSHPEVASCMAPGGQRITVVKGDLTQLDVDVIVNAANKDLKHAGGLAKAIINKGGYSIQKECSDFIKKRGQLMEGDVCCTSAGKLKCKLIVHAVGPVWQNGKNDEEELLREVIMKSMEESSDKKYRSIGIPAICSGIFGFPIQVATKAIAEAVKDFFKEVKNSSIKDVYLCDITDNTVSNFVNGLKKIFGAKNVQEKTTKSFGASHWAPRRGGRTRSTVSSSDDDDDNDSGMSAGSCNIRIKIVKGQIADQAVDALVNTTSRDLRLSNGAVSASLSKIAGPTMQQECSSNYPNGISHGEVAITTGGNLKCKKVFHGSLPGWDAMGTALGVLKKFMSNCLQAADQNNFRTIAFPAMGTGNLGFPKDVVAKEMFQCVGRFSAKNTSSSIKEVRFILYDKDLPTVKAFDDFEQKWNSGGGGGGASGFHGGRGGGDRRTRHFGTEYEDVSADYDGNQQHHGHHKQRGSVNMDPSDMRIGKIEVKIYQGDITMAKTDAIINSSNAEIDLSRGAVAQAISKKGGKELQDEVKTKVQKMKKDGIAVTSSGKGMPCKHIIHVNAENSKSWESRVLESLQAADKLQLSSLAFPALGTGQGFGLKISMIADDMVEAIQKFESSSCQHLQEIHIVIFQTSMVKEFQTEIQNSMGSKLGSGPSKGNQGRHKPGKQGTDNSATPLKSLSEITLVIYADSNGAIRDAIKMIEAEITKEFKEKVFDQRIIKEFSKAQKSAVYALKKFNVEVKFDERNGKITLIGTSADMLEASGPMHNLIRDAERNKQAGQEANLVSDMVQWYIIDINPKGNELIEYKKNVNLVIERAYRDAQPKATFCDADKNEYTVDFNTMKEFPTKNPQDTVDVIRRDLLKDTTFEAPSNWSKMKDNEHVTVVPVPSTDKEYQTVVQHFHQSSQASYPIIKVERIQNRTLYQQYVAKKKLMDSQNKPGNQNEHTLWHGTAGNAKDSINTYGFNRSYCGKNATAFGDGVYFAVNANYSCQTKYSPADGSGNRHIYLCKVLTGEYTQGKGGYRVPPAKNNHILFDSLVDNPNNPNMYIIFNDTQAYPEYLITFK